MQAAAAPPMTAAPAAYARLLIQSPSPLIIVPLMRANAIPARPGPDTS
jgi:hypothetical protein